MKAYHKLSYHKYTVKYKLEKPVLGRLFHVIAYCQDTHSDAKGTEHQSFTIIVQI